MKAVGFRPGILYSSNNCWCFVHLSDLYCQLTTPAYKTADFLVPIYQFFDNKFSISDCMSFTKEILKKGSFLYIWVAEIWIHFFCHSSWRNPYYLYQIDLQSKRYWFKYSEFKKFLSLVTKESDFTFNKLLYRQIDCFVVMGSVLESTLANAYLCFF